VALHGADSVQALPDPVGATQYAVSAETSAAKAAQKRLAQRAEITTRFDILKSELPGR
jgi:hypothetical protein